MRAICCALICSFLASGAAFVLTTPGSAARRSVAAYVADRATVSENEASRRDGTASMTFKQLQERLGFMNTPSVCHDDTVFVKNLPFDTDEGILAATMEAATGAHRTTYSTTDWGR